MQASEPKDTNPYVAVVAKKHRNLKKKLERIAKAEQLLQQGKVLDEEQRVLLASKKAIEKSVAELFNIKQQLEEVAKLEESNKIEGSGSSTSATAPAVDAKQEVNASAEEEIVEATPDADDLQDYGNEQVAEADFKEKFNEFIERLIKALHVYERYTHVTSQQLPDTVMYFGRTLLGLTSISSFQDTLNNSIRVAGFYLHDDLANSNDVIRGTSYAKLAAEIDVLVEEMERVQQRGTNALTALLRTTIAPVSPANTPAAVETTYDSGLYGSLQFGDKPLVSFNQYQYTATSSVYQAAEPAYQAPVVEATRPSVPIAPTLPEFDAVDEEPLEEEIVVEEEEAFDEEDEDVPFTEEGDALEHVEQPQVEAEPEEVPAVVNETEEASKSRFNKNVRVRGDPSRAARKAEDAKKHGSRGAAHHHDAAPVHNEPAQKTFRDRLLSGKAEVAATPAAAAPVETAPAVAAVSEPTAEQGTDKRPAKRAPRSNKKDDAAVDADAAPASAEKPKRDRNGRRPRRTDGENETAPSEASKKWASIAAASSGEGASAVAAAPETAGEGTEKKAPRSSAPKGDRPPRAAGDKPVRARREKKEEAAPAPAASSAEAADGFQAVSRRTPPTSNGAKKEGDKKPHSAPRGDRPAPAKKPAAAPAAVSK